MRPRKSLGQNFLRDETIVRRIIDALNLGPDDKVIEIGPGTGALTYKLVEEAGDVIAIEFDRELIPGLKSQFERFSNFRLVHDDALTVDLEEVINVGGTPSRAKLVANLPYNISTPILQRLIEQRELFSTIVLMFQREVVERITAPPGGKERGFLSVLVESAFDTEYLFDVAPNSFYPVPKVWSAVVRLTPKQSQVTDEKQFRRLISSAFAQKRKTIANNLRNAYQDAGEALSNAGIDGKRRAETLTLNEWIVLNDVISKK